VNGADGGEAVERIFDVGATVNQGVVVRIDARIHAEVQSTLDESACAQGMGKSDSPKA
jgi:hypothetical protein